MQKKNFANAPLILGDLYKRLAPFRPTTPRRCRKAIAALGLNPKDYNVEAMASLGVLFWQGVRTIQ